MRRKFSGYCDFIDILVVILALTITIGTFIFLVYRAYEVQSRLFDIKSQYIVVFHSTRRREYV